jgi:molecular chaperone DnaK
MRTEAKEHEAEDAEKRELVEAKNMAEQLLYTAERSLADHGDKVSEEVKKGVQGKIDALKKYKEGTDRMAIRNATDELSRELSKIGEAMNKQGEAKADEKKDEGDGGESKVRDAETG